MKKDKTKIFMVEVGIELNENSEEYNYYNIKVNGKEKGYQSLYDENILAFLDQKQAKNYIDEYVKNGVKNTYGFMWSIEKDVEDFEQEELKENYFLEGQFYEQEEIIYFVGGKQ